MSPVFGQGCKVLGSRVRMNTVFGQGQKGFHDQESE
jgi:hypothetical protein